MTVERVFELGRFIPSYRVNLWLESFVNTKGIGADMSPTGRHAGYFWRSSLFCIFIGQDDLISRVVVSRWALT